MNERVRVLVRKEFREYRRNKLIIATMGGVPILFLILSLIPLIAVPDNVSPALLRSLAGQALLLFLLIPVILPTTITAYAVIGEREQGTLEPLLTTPATDGEILLAKAFAATAPGIAMTWVLYALFALVVAVFGGDAARGEIVSPRTFAAVGLLAPALGMMAIEISLIISGRSTDIRVAQQLSGLAVLPAVGITSMFAYGVLEPSVGLYAVVAFSIAALDVAGWEIVTRLFDRERVLTRFGS